MGDLLKFSLEDHLTECEERYQDVLDKLDSVDQRLSNIERLVEELKVLVVKR
jgi:hypothetical protein